MKKLFSLLLITCFYFSAQAQTVTQNSGWLMLMNTTKFNDKWGMQFDLQFRSANDWEDVRNVLIRPGVTYYINKNQNVTVGYLYNLTNLSSFIGSSKSFLSEHRIWEQYIVTHKISSIFAQHRFRLEQRFVETSSDDIFAQRFRYFFRFIQPLQKKQENFNKGVFVALQNEAFFNIQNKDQLNGSLFDQNRAYLAAGYRFSPKVDLEAGYMNQFTNGANNNTVNHIIQLALYTRF